MSITDAKIKCGAKTKRAQTACQNPAVTGATRCRLHGGNSLAGFVHPRYKNGRYSRFAPRNLLKKMETAASESSLFELSDDIRLLDARSCELLEEIKQSDKQRKNEIWVEIAGLIEKRRRLVSSEISNKRITLFYVPLGEVAMIIDLIITTIKQEIGNSETEKHLLLKINHQARQFLGELAIPID